MPRLVRPDPRAGIVGSGRVVGRAAEHPRQSVSEPAVPLTQDENSSRPAHGDELPPIVTGLVPPRAARPFASAGSAAWAASAPSAPSNASARRGPLRPALPRPRTVGTHGPGPLPPVPAPGRSRRGWTGLGRAVGGHRRRRLASIGRRAPLAVLGALLLVVGSAVGLGFVSISTDGVGFGRPDAAPVTPTVEGVDGLYPGGPAHRIPFTVRNVEASSFEVTAVRPDLADLPAGCPASAWRIADPSQAPTVAAHAEAELSVPVALAADAPAPCQALAVRLTVHVDGLRHPTPVATPEAAGAGDPAGAVRATGPSAGPLLPGSLDAEAQLTTATLGSPTVTLGVREGRVAVLPARPATGPAPESYEVATSDAAGHPAGDGAGDAVICPAPAGDCVDRSAPAAAERHYVVVARLGTHWMRRSAPVQAWTAPPVPVLAFAGPDGDPARSMVLSTGPAAGAYEVALVADAAPAPFLVEQIAAGEHADRLVQVPAMGPGVHRVVAVARFHGWRAPSGALRLMVSAAGTSTPGTVEDPAPVTAGPGTGTGTGVATSVPGTSAGPSSAETAPAGPVTVGRRAPTLRNRHPVSAPPPVEVAPDPGGPEPAEPDPGQLDPLQPDPGRPDPDPVDPPAPASDPAAGAASGPASADAAASPPSPPASTGRG